MDRLTEKARELVTVKLHDGDGCWFWDGLTWNGDEAKALPMERGRAEILVGQTRRQIADGMTRGISDRCTVAELELEPAPTRAALVRDIRAAFGAEGR